MKFWRRAMVIWFLAAAMAVAEEANYFCVVCGKGPLAGRIWMSKWGAVCDDCYQRDNHCALCGLPVRVGDGHGKTGDGRLICRFDRPNAVLDADVAREIFNSVRTDLISFFGPGFALKFPEVKVDLFDVDYWSEKGRGDGLHKFGFSSTRKTKAGECTHEVVMLSGQLRADLAATAAHEYMHLWINENLAAGRAVDADTVEAICELTAYELMGARRLPAQQKKILENPYTHGAILKALDAEKAHGSFRFVLDWVKNSAAPDFEARAAAKVPPAKIPALKAVNRPVLPPDSLKLGGLLFDGRSRSAVVNGISFAAGETKKLTLRNGIIAVRCREIHQDEAVLDVENIAAPVTLKIGEEKFVP